MNTIVLTTRFKKDFKRSRNRVMFPWDEFEEVLKCLKSGNRIPAKYKDHALTGDLKGYRECHLLYDFILIYYPDPPAKEVYLARVGTHSELF